MQRPAVKASSSPLRGIREAGSRWRWARRVTQKEVGKNKPSLPRRDEGFRGYLEMIGGF